MAEPTLLDYAKVIDWLWEERHDPARNGGTGHGVSTFDMPTAIREAFNDALQRAALGRVAAAMEASAERDGGQVKGAEGEA